MLDIKRLKRSYFDC